MDAEATRVSWALSSCRRLVVAIIVQSKPQLIHLVLMAFNIVAGDAQVVVLADGAVEPRLYVVLAFVAGVDEAVLALVVQLHQHTHGAPLGPPERAKLQVLVPRQSQEGVAAVHQVAGHQGVRVSDGGQRVGGGASDETDDKEDLFVFLHGGI